MIERVVGITGSWEKYVPEFYALSSRDRFFIGYTSNIIKNDKVFVGYLAEKGMVEEYEADLALSHLIRNGTTEDIKMKAIRELNLIRGRPYKAKRKVEIGIMKEYEALDHQGRILKVDTSMEYEEAKKIYLNSSQKDSEKRKKKDKKK
jgi:hypothetical protein